MIQSKKELEFYIKADRLISGKPISASDKKLPKGGSCPKTVIKYLRSMRIVAFYQNTCKHKQLSIRYKYHNYRFKKLGLKLGFTFGCNSFGYGLYLPHYGTIVVNKNIKAGNFCVLHTCTCIGGSDKIIGDGLYLSTGSMIMGKQIRLGDNISVSSNSMVNSSFKESNILLSGNPAVIKKETLPWYIRDGEVFSTRVERINELKIKMGL